jgi:hypothetical protein
MNAFSSRSFTYQVAKADIQTIILVPLVCFSWLLVFRNILNHFTLFSFNHSCIIDYFLLYVVFDTSIHFSLLKQEKTLLIPLPNYPSSILPYLVTANTSTATTTVTVAAVKVNGKGPIQDRTTYIFRYIYRTTT